MAKIQLTQKEIKALKKLSPELNTLAEQKDVPMNPGMGTTAVTMWNELTTDEKMERMREQVKSYQMQIQRQLGRMERTIHNIKHHTHDKEGRAIVSKGLTEYYGEDGDSMLATAPGIAIDNRGEYF